MSSTGTATESPAISDVSLEESPERAAVLDADRKATAGREFYDDGYFVPFTNSVRPIIEQRVSEAASGVASAIVSAWIEAGKPVLPVKIVRPPARIVR